MPDLKFAVLFSAVDQLSDKLGAIGEAMGKFTDRVTAAGEHLAGAGERMVEWGEKVGIVTAVLSEGADKLHEWSEALSEPAYGMQRSMATMAAMAGLGGDALDKVKARAIAFANTHPGITAEQWADGFTRMRGIFRDTAKAISAEDTAATLSRFGVEGAAAANLLAAAWSDLRSPAQQAGDALMRTIQLFSLAPDSAQRLAMAVGRLGGTTAQTNTTLPELLSLVGQAAQQFGGGGHGVMMFSAMIREMVQKSAEGKSIIDWSHGLARGFAQMRAEIARLPAPDRLETLKRMGTSDPAAMATFLGHLDAVAGIQQQIALSAGTLGKAYGTMTRNAADQTALLHQNISNLYDAIYSPALTTITGWLTDLTNAAQNVSTIAEHHSTIARYAALSLTALGGGMYYGLQGLATFGTMTAFAGKGIEGLGKLLDVQSHYLRVLYAWDCIKNIAAAVKGFGSSVLGAIPSIVRFSAVLYANPLTWYVAGAVALGLAAYEIYEHWGALATFFEGIWTRVKGIYSGFSSWVENWASAIGKYVLMGLSGPFGIIGYEIYQHWDAIKKVFSDAMDWMRNAGAKMVKALGEGILSAIEWPIKAAKSLAAKIGGYFHFYSPPSYGPLREAILNFRFGEELAKYLQPAPIVTAAEQMAEIAAAPINLWPGPVPIWTSPPVPVSFWERGNLVPCFPLPLKGGGLGWGLMVPSLWNRHSSRMSGREDDRLESLSHLGEPQIVQLAPIVNFALPKPIIAAPVVTAAPERKAAATTTALAPSRGTQPVTINVSYTVNAASPQDWVKAARQHADELMRIIDDKLTRRQRLQFA